MNRATSFMLQYTNWRFTQFPQHMKAEVVYRKFSPVPTASCAKARLMLLIINWQELPTLETVHEELEEQFEIMQVQINRLK